MYSLTFRVDAKPPWKQTPADAWEKGRQAVRKEALQIQAQAAVNGMPALTARCSVSIRYVRKTGQGPDGGNIVGGVLDALEGIVFINDRQVVDISYAEHPGTEDWYQVTVTELEF